jgi:hypothetical protein
LERVVSRAATAAVLLAITMLTGCGQGVADTQRSPGSIPTPAPTDVQPGFPIRAAFYYPWFPEAWNQQGFNPFTKYHPALGFYDSSSTAVIRSHIASMQAAGFAAGISSWWGRARRPTVG